MELMVQNLMLINLILKFLIQIFDINDNIDLKFIKQNPINQEREINIKMLNFICLNEKFNNYFKINLEKYDLKHYIPISTKKLGNSEMKIYVLSRTDTLLKRNQLKLMF